MLFQYGGAFTNVFYDLQQWGIFDILIPFILIFTILYAILSKINVFGEKRFNSIIALAITLIVVIPHILGTYPPGTDVIVMINNSLPEVVLLIVAVALLMIMTGLVYGEWPVSTPLSGIAAIIAGVLVAAIFISNFVEIPVLSYIDPQIQSLIVIMAVFGLVFIYVTSGKEGDSKTIGQHVESLFKKIP